MSSPEKTDTRDHSGKHRVTLECPMTCLGLGTRVYNALSTVYPVAPETVADIKRMVEREELAGIRNVGKGGRTAIKEAVRAVVRTWESAPAQQVPGLMLVLPEGMDEAWMLRAVIGAIQQVRNSLAVRVVRLTAELNQEAAGDEVWVSELRAMISASTSVALGLDRALVERFSLLDTEGQSPVPP
jgi:hypothetical protein